MAAPKKAQVSTVASSAPADTGGSWGGGYGGGGGGSYNVTYSKAKDPIDTEDLDAQLANAASALGKQNAATAKAGKDALNNIQDQRKNNAQQLLMKNAQLARNSEWQPNQQKEQSVLNNMRRTMGNAAYGSGLQDLQEGMSRFDDMADVELINTWKENQDEAYNNWYQANADLISDYNEQVIRTNSAFDEAYNNYLGNIANINSKLGKQAYDEKNAGKELTQQLGFDEDKNGSVSGDEDQGTIKATIAKNNAAETYKMTELLKMLTNKATANNPNIPDTNGIVDYIRPNNAVAEARNKALGNVGKVNTAAGAFAPTKVNSKINPMGRRVIQKLAFPGYNYQRENFASYNPRS